MKIRVTLMTENDKVVDASKDSIEKAAKRGWDYFMDVVNSAAKLDGKNEHSYVEKVELVDGEYSDSTFYREPDPDPMIIKD